MSFVTHLEGLASGARYPADRPMNLDPVDGRPVQMVYDLERLSAQYPGGRWRDPSRHDLWRFGPLLPLDITEAGDAASVVSLGEGFTPELYWPDHPLARRIGFELYMKDEGRAHPGYGANPTGSFKDRGMSVAVSMAASLGLDRLVVPTQGNAGDSLATYARAAGMACAVIMPRNTPMPILGKVAAYALEDPRHTLELVDGTIREAGERMKRHWLPEGWFNMATFQEPGWRIEGKKTLGLELAEPKSPGDSWSLPDAIVYPTGGGTGVLGMYKAFDELQALGLVDDRRPRLYCVQADATRPLVDAWAAGADDTTPARGGETLAYGLNVPGGVGHFRVLECIRRSGGAAIAIDETAMADALSRTWNEKRWWVCPEGAACVAALDRLADHGWLRRGERVVVINTGSLEKYLPALRHLL